MAAILIPSRPRPTVPAAEPRTDAEFDEEARVRAERLRSWLPTVVSVLALLGVAAGLAVFLNTAAGFGAYLVTGL